MYNVTDEYKENIYALSRRILGRVTFDISPISLDADTNTITTSTPFIISNNSQLNDNVRENTFNLITWETDRVLLDGSFTFPGDDSSDWGHVGWTGNALSALSGLFTAPQTIKFAFGESHSSAGITVTFEPFLGEYAVNFSVTVYDALNNVIHLESVTDNTDVQYVILTDLVNFNRIELSISKWSVPYRRARVAEIDVGVLLVYDNNKLIRLSLTEEVDPIAAALVVPEFEFTVDNTAKEFDMFSTSGIYANLQQRQRIVPELGLELENRVEWVPLGVFLLSEWRSDAGAMTATFKGRNKLDLLDLYQYEQLTAISGYTIKTLIAAILDACGIGNYVIDDALDLIDTNGISEKRSAREALQLALIAGCATGRVTRDDVLRIETNRDSDVSDVITFDEMTEESMIELERAVKTVEVTYYSDIQTANVTETAIDANVPNGERLAIEKNTFINDAVRAQAVADWMLLRKQERMKITVNYRGNMALDVLDKLTIENSFITGLNVYNVKHQLSYEGYLSGRLEGRA